MSSVDHTHGQRSRNGAGMAPHAREAHQSDRFREQIERVRGIIEAEGVFSADKIRAEVDWFYNHLGLHEVYFTAHTPEMIAKHIQGLMGARLRGGGAPMRGARTGPAPP